MFDYLYDEKLDSKTLFKADKETTMQKESNFSFCYLH